MTKTTPHINRVTLAILGIAIAGLTAATFAAPAAPASSMAYNYPVKPFTAEHPVRGNFGDPRTVFKAPPTPEGAVSGAGSFQFHFGVDISAPDGTAVYPVVSGTVSERHADWVGVSSDGHRAFQYWHIRPVVAVGDHVTAYQTVLGRIVRGAMHVHLTELQDGRPVNPLQSGHLTPYTDTTAPQIGAISVSKSLQTLELPSFLRGRIDCIVEVHDVANRPVPGIWANMPVAPALITWRVQSMTGKTVLGPLVAVDFRTNIPPNPTFWRVYARGSYQNMAVFGTHYSYGQPGRYLYRLTRGPFDTATLKDGVYDLVVTAADIRGNESSASLRITVHNRPGWIGS